MTAPDISLHHDEERVILQQRALLAPLRGTLAWWGFSIIVFAALFPAEEKVHLGRVLAIVMGASFATYVGYTKASSRRTREILFSPSTRPPVMLIAISAAVMIFTGIASASALGFTPGSVTDSVGHLGAAYQKRGELQQGGDTGTTGTLLVSALFFLFPFAVPLSIMHWTSVPYWVRGLVLAGIVSYGGYFLAGGTMKGFGDLTILLIIGLIAKSSRSSISQGRQIRSRRLRRRWLFVQGAALAAFALLVATAMASRLRGQRPELPAFQQDGMLGRLLGPHWAVGVDAMTAYFAKGYRGLGISTDYPPSYQVYGGFRGVSDLLSRYLGLNDAYPHALPFTAEHATGYSATANWWTVFPWLASDFGWVGAVLFVGVIAALAGRLWVDIVYRQDPLCIGLFYFVLTFLFFVPANNQVFMDSGSTLGSTILLAAYFIRGITRSGLREDGKGSCQLDLPIPREESEKSSPKT